MINKDELAKCIIITTNYILLKLFLIRLVKIIIVRIVNFIFILNIIKKILVFVKSKKTDF